MHKTQYSLQNPGSYVFTSEGGLRCYAGEEPVIVVVETASYTLDDILKRVVEHEREYHQVRH